MERIIILKARDGQPLMAIATEDTYHEVLDYAQDFKNEMSEEFSAKFYTLKQMTIEIGDEALIQEKIIQRLENDVDRSSAVLKKTRGTFFVIKEENDIHFSAYVALLSLFTFFCETITSLFKIP